MRKFLIALAATAVTATATVALADRPVTEDERVKLVAALAAVGCSGGEMEFDDGKFEVDDARCSDGKEYDIDFARDFELIKKELDD